MLFTNYCFQLNRLGFEELMVLAFVTGRFFDSYFLLKVFSYTGLYVCPSIPLGRNYSLNPVVFRVSIFFIHQVALFLLPFGFAARAPELSRLNCRESEVYLFPALVSRTPSPAFVFLEAESLLGGTGARRHHWPGFGSTSLALERQCQLLCPFQPFRHRGHILKIETFVDSVYCTCGLI